MFSAPYKTLIFYLFYLCTQELQPGFHSGLSCGHDTVLVVLSTGLQPSANNTCVASTCGRCLRHNCLLLVVLTAVSGSACEVNDDYSHCQLVVVIH